MKPLGTVTMHYDFVTSEEREILAATLSEASDYRDFVIMLGCRADFGDMSAILAHILAVHAWELRETDVTKRVAELYGSHPLVKPWTYPIRSRGDRLSVQHKVSDAVDEALFTKPAKWLRMELLLLKAYALILTPQGTAALDEAKAILEDSPELRCYSPYIYHIDTRIMWQEGDLSRAVRTCDEGITLAQELENLYEKARLLNWRGILAASFMPREALEFHEEAYQLASDLGSRFLMDACLIEMGGVSVILGEYDLALGYHHKGTSIYNPPDGPTDQHAVALSLIHNDLQNLDDSLTWATWAIEKHQDVGSEGDVWTLCSMCMPLIALERLEEAKVYLERAKRMAFASGHEFEMAFYYYVSGLYEAALGNLSTAAQLSEDALTIFERQGDRAFVNRSLYTLAKLELEVVRERGEPDDARHARPWTRRFGLQGRDNQLPGAIVQHALLEAEYNLIADSPEAAKEVLAQALEYCDSPGFISLQKRVIEKIKTIESEQSKEKLEDAEPTLD